MITNDMIFDWCFIEHDIYEEDGHIFGVELVDLLSNEKCFYYKFINQNGSEHYQYLKGDVFAAIEQFNAILKESDDTYDKLKVHLSEKLEHWKESAERLMEHGKTEKEESSRP